MPTVKLIEQVFLDRWRNTDFSTYNETEVREEFLIHLLHALGWRKGTTYDLEMEKSLKLSTPYHRIGRKEVAIDYAPSIQKRYFWIIEAKPGKEREMRESDLLQAHLYAIHPQIQARLIVLANGWEVRVYDALTVSSWGDPLLVVKQTDADEQFLALREMVGADDMLAYQRTRLLDILRTTFESEVDLAAFDKMSWQMRNLATEGRATVQENAKKAWMQGMAKYFGEEATALATDSIEIVMIKMDHPIDARPPPINEFVRRVRSADRIEQARLIELLIENCDGRPHNVFRTGALRVLVEVAEAGLEIRSSAVANIQICISRLAIGHIRYFDFNPTINALCHLDNIALRLAMKMCLRRVHVFEDILAKWKETMSPLEWAKTAASVDGLVHGATGHLAEILWRGHCREPLDREIWEGIWNLQAIEAEVEKLPDPNYLGPVIDLHCFAHLGHDFDQLIAGTWNILNRKREVLNKSEVDSSVLAFLDLSREEALRRIPAEHRPPEGWVSSATMAEFEALFAIVLGTRIEGTIGVQLQKARYAT
jgi:hypothetical protein